MADAQNAASVSIATIPVETGEELVIEVMEIDVEVPCIELACERVAVYEVVAPGIPCGPHPICLVHGDLLLRFCADLMTAVGPRPYPFECIPHGHQRFLLRLDQVTVRPWRQRCSA